MATLRHGGPVQVTGWLYKDRQVGKFFRTKRCRRYLCLRGCILSSHHDERSPATWEISVLNCPVLEGSGKYELCVELPQRKVSFYADDGETFRMWRDALKNASSRSVEDFYDIGKLLGQGAYAEVRTCRDRETKEEFAIKLLKKDFKPTEMECILREMNIMKSVVHPNIITTYDVFDTKNIMYIVLELMQGGELFDIVASAGNFSERRASIVMREIVGGVAYLHMHSIVHRDLKPENVLCKNNKWPYGVKLADFGLASYLRDDWDEEVTPKNMIGTVGYVAPEVVRKEKCGAPVDMWACGVILFIMLAGKMPFYGKSEGECLKMTSEGRYSFPDREWKNISPEAKSLVRALLQVDPNKRLTAKACLHHPWLSSSHLSDADINNDLSGLHSNKRKFRRAAFAAMTAAKISMLASAATEAATEATSLQERTRPPQKLEEPAKLR